MKNNNKIITDSPTGNMNIKNVKAEATETVSKKEVVNMENNKVSTQATTRNKKMAKKDWLQVLNELVSASTHARKNDLLDFISNEIQLLDKKAEKAKTSKSSKANETIRTTVLEVLAEQSEGVTITELLQDKRLQSYTEEKGGKTITSVMSNQRLSAIIRKMLDEKLVIRTEKKKKAYFSLPGITIEETKE